MALGEALGEAFRDRFLISAAIGVFPPLAWVMLLLWGGVLWRVWRIVVQAGVGALLYRGVATAIFWMLLDQILLHLAINFGLIPPLTIHFPLLSFNFVLAIVSMAALGIVNRIHYETKTNVSSSVVEACIEKRAE